MADMDDYLTRKRAQLGLDRADRLIEIQTLIDTWYPGQVRAKSLNGGVLQLVTPSSVVAGELRMRQVELIAHFSDVEKLKLSIASL